MSLYLHPCIQSKGCHNVGWRWLLTKSREEVKFEERIVIVAGRQRLLVGLVSVVYLDEIRAVAKKTDLKEK